jgi:hypothetical protein
MTGIDPNSSRRYQIAPNWENQKTEIPAGMPRQVARTLGTGKLSLARDDFYGDFWMKTHF